MIEEQQFTERGFRRFAAGRVRVWESSLPYEGAHCWLAFDREPPVMLLSVFSAELLAEQLEQFANAKATTAPFTDHDETIWTAIASRSLLGQRRCDLVGKTVDGSHQRVRLSKHDALAACEGLRAFADAARRGLLTEPAEPPDEDENDDEDDDDF